MKALPTRLGQMARRCCADLNAVPHLLLYRLFLVEVKSSNTRQRSAATNPDAHSPDEAVDPKRSDWRFDSHGSSLCFSDAVSTFGIQ